MIFSDVELRFVERSVPAPELGESIGKIARILQMRKKGRVELQQGGVSEYWTEWRDVPLAADLP